MPIELDRSTLDANETAFFSRQLEHIKSRTYDIKYPELKVRSLIPVSFEAGPGTAVIKWEQYDQVGMAKIISSYADDLPRADVKGKSFFAPVKSLGNSYGFSVQEIREAMQAGVPLQQRKANAAKRAMAQAESRIAFFGDQATGLLGFLNNPNITRSIATTGAANSTRWAQKTADEIMNDINGAFNLVTESTNGVESANTLLLPLAQYNIIKDRRFNQYSDKSILRYLMETNEAIKDVQWVNELKGAGPTGGDILIAYDKNPDKITLEIPQDFEQFPEQVRNLEHVVPCHQRIGGVLIHYPMSVNVLEGI